MKRMIFMFLVCLLAFSATAADPSFFGHSAGEIDFQQNVQEDIRISGYTSGWNGWRYTLQFTYPNHAMIYFPYNNMGMGLHKNGNFYYSSVGDKHVMRLSSTGNLYVEHGPVTVQGSSITSKGQKVCMPNGNNCPNLCRGKSEGQEWTVSSTCTRTEGCNCYQQCVRGTIYRCQEYQEVCTSTCTTSGTRTARLRCVGGYPVALSPASECA